MKKTDKKERAKLYAEDMAEQMAASTAALEKMRSQMLQLQSAINIEQGILDHARFVSERFDLPNRPVEKKELEVVKNESEKS
jgi:hypothetical protein